MTKPHVKKAKLKVNTQDVHVTTVPLVGKALFVSLVADCIVCGVAFNIRVLNRSSFHKSVYSISVGIRRLLCISDLIPCLNSAFFLFVSVIQYYYQKCNDYTKSIDK